MALESEDFLQGLGGMSRGCLGLCTTSPPRSPVARHISPPSTMEGSTAKVGSIQILSKPQSPTVNTFWRVLTRLFGKDRCGAPKYDKGEGKHPVLWDGQAQVQAAPWPGCFGHQSLSVHDEVTVSPRRTGRLSGFARAKCSLRSCWA